MSFENDFTRRLTESVERVDTQADLTWVQSEAERRQRRRGRVPAVVGTFVVALVGLGGLVYLVGDQTAPDDEPPTAAAPSTTVGDGTGTTDAPRAVSDGETDDLRAGGPAIAALADEFVADAPEVYRREMPEGVFVVHRSERSWSEVFDLAWRAPTGSASLCMGDAALFLRVAPDGATTDRFPWVPVEVFDDPAGTAVVHDSYGYSGMLVQIAGAADEVALVVDGDERDRAPVANGLAVVDMSDVWTVEASGEPFLSLIAEGVPLGEPVPFTYERGRASAEYLEQCLPPAHPVLPLPPPGIQPDDPAAAEAAILDAFDRARDRSVALVDEEPMSVDDPTGIEAAADDVFSGELAEVAATAEFVAGEFVFTAPDQAWFTYTIRSTSGDFDQFGRATFNGADWQITRDTLCQDLALAGGTCIPESSDIVPPIPDDWEAGLREHERIAQLYWTSACLPPPFGMGNCTDG